MPRFMRLLWICADPGSVQHLDLRERLRSRWEVRARTPLEALAELQAAGGDLAVAVLPVTGWTADELLEAAQRACPRVPVILRGADLSASDAVRLTRLGAHHCGGPEMSDDDLFHCLERAREECRDPRDAAGAPPESWKRFLVGESPAMRQVENIIRLVAEKRCTVLITGETGTGKEMAARALHQASGRAALPMVSVNCGALPEHLLEAELFGHVKGAFTGAVNQRVGRFEQAHKSTLFLDEIGSMPLDLQVKLLRVLQEREFQRLGSSETMRVDVRLIAASNENLAERVRQGKFRQDLYYRLNVVPVQMPPLRDRVTDIPILVRHFIEKVCRTEEIPPKSISREALQPLCSQAWPGNVRELENAVEMAIALSGDRPMLYPADFPLNLAAQGSLLTAGCLTKAPLVLPEDGIHFDSAVNQFQRAILQQALKRARGNKTVAAGLLGLKRTTLLAKMRHLELSGQPMNPA